MEKLNVHLSLVKRLVRETNLSGEQSSAIVRDMIMDWRDAQGQETDCLTLYNGVNAIVSYLIGYLGKFPRRNYGIANGDDEKVIWIIRDFMEWSQVTWDGFQEAAENIFRMESKEPDWSGILREKARKAPSESESGSIDDMFRDPYGKTEPIVCPEKLPQGRAILQDGSGRTVSSCGFSNRTENQDRR